jgi:16S rRNA (adenine1518-N6/adenine1519-N6)-dimethyltransferase
VLPELDELTRGYLLRLVTRYRLRLRKRLGQHFVVDPSVIRDMVNHVDPGSRVLEIGTGIGILTYYLAKRALEVVTIEIDDRFVRIAKELLGGLANVSIIRGDALKLPWPRVDIVVSNVPYSITSPLIVRIVREGVPKALLTIQREVADRLVSEPGGDDYGRLTVIVKCNYLITVLNTYPPGSFYPSPEVYSSLVMMSRKEPCHQHLEEVELVTNILFRHRNKVLRWVLSKYLGREALRDVVEGGFDVDVRVRQLGIDDIARLIKILRPYMGRLRAAASGVNDYAH